MLQTHYDDMTANLQDWKTSILNKCHRILLRPDDTHKKKENSDEVTTNFKECNDILHESQTKTVIIKRSCECTEDVYKNFLDSSQEWQEAEAPSEEDVKKYLDRLYLEVQQKRCACPCESPFFYELIEPIQEQKNRRLFCLPLRPRKVCCRRKILKPNRFLSRRTLF